MQSINTAVLKPMTKRTIFLWFIIACATSSSAVAQTVGCEGFIEPIETVHVAAPEPGIVKTVHVQEGQNVRAGQELVTLDHAVLSAQLAAAEVKAQATGAIEAAQATWQLKEERLKKIRTLHQNGNASPEELQRALSEEVVARSNVTNVEEQLKAHEMEVRQIEARIERRIIRSPIDGVVLQLPKVTGESISTSEPDVATVVRLDKLKVTFYLATREATRLQPGSPLPLNIPASQQAVTSKVHFVSPVTDSDSDTVRMITHIDNPKLSIRSGLRCQIQGRDRTAIGQLRHRNQMK